MAFTRLLWIISLGQPHSHDATEDDEDSGEDGSIHSDQKADDIKQYVDDTRAVIRLGATVSNYAIYVGITMPHLQILSECTHAWKYSPIGP